MNVMGSNFKFYNMRFKGGSRGLRLGPSMGINFLLPFCSPPHLSPSPPSPSIPLLILLYSCD